MATPSLLRNDDENDLQGFIGYRMKYRYLRVILALNVYYNVSLTGTLLEKITSDIIKKRERAIPTKMFLYSAHENSLLNILRVLDRETTTVLQMKPEFSSAVIIELHHVNNNTVIQVIVLS